MMAADGAYSVKLGSLRNISKSLHVCSNPDCEMEGSGYATGRRRHLLLDSQAFVDLPLLESAMYIGINGSITKLVYPPVKHSRRRLTKSVSPCRA